MAKFKNLIGRNQIADAAISLVELDVTLQNQITQITNNKNAIQAIVDSKGVAGGLATLDTDGFILPSQLRQASISEWKGEVATVADLVTVTTAGRGDVVDVVPAGDADRKNAQSYFLFGDDPTVLTNWKPVRSPQDGVISLRNASGSVAGLNGVVTLADVAFSGAANDLSFTDASYIATNVSDALTEVMDKVTTIEDDMGGKLALAGFHPYVELTGTIDGTNAAFTSPVSLSGAKVVAMMGGQVIHGTEFSVAGNVVTFNSEPT